MKTLFKIALAGLAASAAVVAAPALAQDSGPSATGGLTGDAANGRSVFARCQACHSVQAGQNRVGPSLNNIVGRSSGSVEGFRYSQANQSSDVVWTEAVLFEYLANPRAFMPGTIMAFPGLANPQERADVIAYLSDPSAVQ